MIDACSPSLDVLMKLLHSEIAKFKSMTDYQDEAPVLEYIWDNLEHQLVEIGVLDRDYNRK